MTWCLGCFSPNPGADQSVLCVGLIGHNCDDGRDYDKHLFIWVSWYVLCRVIASIHTLRTVAVASCVMRHEEKRDHVELHVLVEKT